MIDLSRQVEKNECFGLRIHIIYLSVYNVVFLVFCYETTTNLVFLWSYLIVYNVALYVIFSSLLQFVSFDLKTLQTLSRLGSGVFFSNTLTIALFSMAGVPPFVGFFTKVFIFDLLADMNFFVFYAIAFLLLFVGLYFYIQNIRFLYGAHRAAFVPSMEFGVRTVPLYYYTTLVFLTGLVFGMLFLEEVVLWGRWLLV